MFVSTYVHLLTYTLVGFYKIITEEVGKIYEEQILPPHCALKKGEKISISSAACKRNLWCWISKLALTQGWILQGIKRGPSSCQTEQTQVQIPVASATKRKLTHPLPACYSLTRDPLESAGQRHRPWVPTFDTCQPGLEHFLDSRTSPFVQSFPPFLFHQDIWLLQPLTHEGTSSAFKIQHSRWTSFLGYRKIKSHQQEALLLTTRIL